MTKLVLITTMSLDGFFDRGFIGYPTASGLLPYWLDGKPGGA